MKQCPYCSKDFETWKSARGHTSSCTKNTGEYYIHQELGPIHHTKILEYQGVFKLNDSLKLFRKRGFDIPNREYIYSKQEVIGAIQAFAKEHGRIPQYRDFGPDDHRYPSTGPVKRLFGTWNKAIAAAGFEPNIQTGFGIPTYGKDGHLYRSKAEANFANKYLFEQYDYQIEPHYPAPHSDWMYDWYVCDLDLYIELDGGLRPWRMLEKIAFNKELGRECLVIEEK